MRLSCALHVTSCDSLSCLKFSSIFQDFIRLSHKDKTTKACGGVNEENVVSVYAAFNLIVLELSTTHIVSSGVYNDMHENT